MQIFCLCRKSIIREESQDSLFFTHFSLCSLFQNCFFEYFGFISLQMPCLLCVPFLHVCDVFADDLIPPPSLVGI